MIIHIINDSHVTNSIISIISIDIISIIIVCIIIIIIIINNNNIIIIFFSNSSSSSSSDTQVVEEIGHTQRRVDLNKACERVYVCSQSRTSAQVHWCCDICVLASKAVETTRVIHV